MSKKKHLAWVSITLETIFDSKNKEDLDGQALKEICNKYKINEDDIVDVEVNFADDIWLEDE